MEIKVMKKDENEKAEVEDQKSIMFLKMAFKDLLEKDLISATEYSGCMNDVSEKEKKIKAQKKDMDIQKKLDGKLEEVLLKLYNKREEYPHFPHLNLEITDLMADEMYKMEEFKDKEVFIVAGYISDNKKPKKHACVVVKDGPKEKVYNFTKYEQSGEKIEKWENDYLLSPKTDVELKKLLKELVDINNSTSVDIINFYNQGTIRVM